MNDADKTLFVDVPDTDSQDLPILEKAPPIEAELDHLHAVDRVFEELEANLFRLDQLEETGGSHATVRTKHGSRDSR